MVQNPKLFIIGPYQEKNVDCSEYNRAVQIHQKKKN